MPFPLIPVLFVAVGVVTAAKGTVDTVKSVKRCKRAKRRRRAASAALDDAVNRVESCTQVLANEHARLVVVRGIAVRLLGEAVRWLGHGRVGGMSTPAEVRLPAVEATEWEQLAGEGGALVGELGRGVAGQVGVRTLATELVRRFGVAGTGTAIRALGGAAGRNALLAAIGGGPLAAGGGGVALGGLLLGGVNVGFAALSVGFAARRIAAHRELETEHYVGRCEAERLRLGEQASFCGVAAERCAQLRRGVNAVAHELGGALSTSDPSDGGAALRIVALGRCLGALARGEVIDEAGELISGWGEALQALPGLGLTNRDDDFEA